VPLKDLTILSEIDVAYMSGLIDGEGCIHISEDHKTFNGKKYTYHTLVLTIANSDPRMLLWIEDHFGGKVVPKTKCETNRRQAWTWSVVSREAEAVLRLITPYLISKKDQAELALKFRDSYVNMPVHKGRKLPNNIVQFRVSCFKEIKQMKRDIQPMEVCRAVR
jgi:hypothetical protein